MASIDAGAPAMLPMPPDLYPAEWVVWLHSGQSREFYCFSTVQILGSCLAMVHMLRLVLYLTGIVTGLDLDDSCQQPTSHALALLLGSGVSRSGVLLGSGVSRSGGSRSGSGVSRSTSREHDVVMRSSSSENV